MQSYSHNVIDAHKTNPAERIHPSDWKILAIAKDPQRQPQQVEEVWRCLPMLTGIYVLCLIHKRIMLEAGLVCRAPFFLFLLFRIQGHCMRTCCFGAPYSPWRHNPIFSSKHPWWSYVGLQPLLKARWSRSTQLGWTSCRGPNLLRGSYGSSPPSCPTRSSSRGLRCSSTRDYIGHYPEIYTCLAFWLCRARLSAQPHERSLFFRESWSVAMTKKYKDPIVVPTGVFDYKRVSCMDEWHQIVLFWDVPQCHLWTNLKTQSDDGSPTSCLRSYNHPSLRIQEGIDRPSFNPANMLKYVEDGKMRMETLFSTLK